MVQGARHALMPAILRNLHGPARKASHPFFRVSIQPVNWLTLYYGLCALRRLAARPAGTAKRGWRRMILRWRELKMGRTSGYWSGAWPSASHSLGSLTRQENCVPRSPSKRTRGLDCPRTGYGAHPGAIWRYHRWTPAPGRVENAPPFSQTPQTHR